MRHRRRAQEPRLYSFLRFFIPVIGFGMILGIQATKASVILYDGWRRQKTHVLKTAAAIGLRTILLVSGTKAAVDS
jgi:hypothetical protein